MDARETNDWVELAERAGDGLDVRLWWSRTTGRVKVAVTRVPTGEVGEVHVRPDHALDAFYHPFAYAASRGAVVTRPRNTDPVTTVPGGER